MGRGNLEEQSKQESKPEHFSNLNRLIGIAVICPLCPPLDTTVTRVKMYRATEIRY